MRIPTLSIVTVLVLILLPVLPAQAEPAAAGSDSATAAAKKKREAKAKAKRRTCKKGYALKTVTVKRKDKKVRVKRCRKKPSPKRQSASPEGPASSSPTPGPTPAPGRPKPLFDPPGARLEGAAAQPFLDRYLTNSRFTDCPAGWPSCAAEQRYSHAAGMSFLSCTLPNALGSIAALSYAIETASVEPDGSWTFDAVVQTSPKPSFYHWNVAVDGTVTGNYKVPGPTPPVAIGPFQYVAGARDCGS